VTLLLLANRFPRDVAALVGQEQDHA
jgi:hypothetical protein